MRGAFWMMPKLTLDDLYDRRVTVRRNTMPLKNRARMADYIWAIEDCTTKKVLSIATEVPLVGGPLCFWLDTDGNPAVMGRIPPGQVHLSSAFPVTPPVWATKRIGECILTSDGEVWASGNMPPVRYSG